MTRLAAPHATASTTGIGSDQVPRHQQPSARLPHRIHETHMPYNAAQTTPSSGFNVVASPSASPAPAIAAIRARAPASAATRSPVRPSAIAVVCCGVYHSERGTLSMRKPRKRHAVMASMFVSSSPDKRPAVQTAG